MRNRCASEVLNALMRGAQGSRHIGVLQQGHTAVATLCGGARIGDDRLGEERARDCRFVLARIAALDLQAPFLLKAGDHIQTAPALAQVFADRPERRRAIDEPDEPDEPDELFVPPLRSKPIGHAFKAVLCMTPSYRRLGNHRQLWRHRPHLRWTFGVVGTCAGDWRRRASLPPRLGRGGPLLPAPPQEYAELITGRFKSFASVQELLTRAANVGVATIVMTS